MFRMKTNMPEQVARGLNVKPILYKNPFWVVELYENPKMIFGEFKNQCNKFLKLL